MIKGKKKKRKKSNLKIHIHILKTRFRFVRDPSAVFVLLRQNYQVFRSDPLSSDFRSKSAHAKIQQTNKMFKRVPMHLVENKNSAEENVKNTENQHPFNSLDPKPANPATICNGFCRLGVLTVNKKKLRPLP